MPRHLGDDWLLPGLDPLSRPWFTSGKIEEIDRALSEVSPMMRVQLQEQFACELRARPRAEQDWTLDAILVLTDFTPYDIQRRTLGYDDERIADTWRYAMHALLT